MTNQRWLGVVAVICIILLLVSLVVDDDTETVLHWIGGIFVIGGLIGSIILYTTGDNTVPGTSVAERTEMTDTLGNVDSELQRTEAWHSARELTPEEGFSAVTS